MLANCYLPIYLYGVVLIFLTEMTSGNGEIGEPEPQDSHSKDENLENVKNEFLENQLKEIQNQLRDNTNEIKKLKETAQLSWDLVRKNFLSAQPSVQKTAIDLMAKQNSSKSTGQGRQERGVLDVHVGDRTSGYNSSWE